jgi:hypothetical protein
MDARRILIFAVAVVLIAFGLYQMRDGLATLFQGPGVGADPTVAAGAQNATKAANAFAALAAGSATGGAVPRQSDPAAGPLLDTVFDVDLLRSKPTLSDADLPALGEWSGAGAKVGRIYILAGTGATEIAEAAGNSQTLEQADRNTALYAPEIGRYMDEQLLIQGAIAEIVAAADGGARSGIDDIRSGMASTMTGVLTSFATAGIDNDWRLQRVVTLTAVAPSAAKLLLREQCSDLREASARLGQTSHDPAIRAALEGFKAALTC